MRRPMEGTFAEQQEELAILLSQESFVRITNEAVE
jgi:hypothetical protein